MTSGLFPMAPGYAKENINGSVTAFTELPAGIGVLTAGLILWNVGSHLNTILTTFLDNAISPCVRVVRANQRAHSLNP